MAKPVEQLERVIIRFAGDSGDGMQLTGGRFTSETALFGNDLSTLPDFPAEIRAPAGSLPGVSGFQIHFSDHDILTPGDAPNVLVAMNPAALRTNLNDLPPGGTLIVNTDAFTDRNLQKAGYTSNPLEDGTLDEYRVHESAADVAHARGAEGQSASRTARPSARRTCSRSGSCRGSTRARPRARSTSSRRSSPSGRRSPRRTRARSRPGYAFGETAEGFATQYEVAPAELAPGTYRNITGNQALGARAGRGQRPVEAAAVPERVPDHAGLGHPPRPRAPQELRGPDVPGRGRDRGRRRRARRELRRRARRLHVERAGRRS